MLIESYGTPLLLKEGITTVLPRLPLGSTSGTMSYDEDYIRNLAFDHPSCLPIAEIDSAYKHAIPICKELNTPAGPIDALFATSDGRLVILEAKLWRNPEARRKVVAQILDYAKELSRWDYEDLQRVVSANTGRKGNSLMEIVREQHPDLDEISFVDSVSRGLKQGRFLLLIVGDGIREGAASIADFIQRVGTLEFTFGLVELALYGTEESGVLVQPRVIAKTEIVERSVVVIRDGRFELAENIVPGEGEVAELSESDRWYLDFWSELVSTLRFDDPEQPPANPGKRGNLFFQMPPGKGLAWLSAYFVQKDGKVGVYITFEKGSLAERLYAGLLAEKGDIDRELAIPVQWENKDGKCYISSSRNYADLKSPTSREEIQEFLKDALNRYVNAFRPRLKRLTEDQ